MLTLNFRTNFSILLFPVCVVAFVGFVVRWSDASPKELLIENGGFEQPVLGRGEKSFEVTGWITEAPASHPNFAVDDEAVHCNRAKAGRQWLSISPGGAVGQRLGTIETLKKQLPDVERLFVSLLLSSDQAVSTTNEINLSIEIYFADSSKNWHNGKLVSSKRIVDLGNDIRGDLNSYIDGYALLVPGFDKLIQELDSQCWLVLRNNLPLAKTSSSVLIDQVNVSLAPRKPIPDLPNILIVLQDDLGYGDVSALNSESHVETYNVDRLARQGMLFTDAHTAATICGPSRIGLLTGTMPSKLGVRGNFAVGGNDRLGPSTLPAGTPTIATLCKSAGYDTAVVGKWGIPSSWELRGKGAAVVEIDSTNASEVADFKKPLSNAEAFGFSYRYIFDENRPFVLGETEPFENNPQPFGWHENGFAVRDVLTHSQDQLHEYYLRAITDRAIRYIQTKAGLRSLTDGDFRIEDGNAPFYLHYLTHAPHLPIVPAAQFVGKTRLGTYGDFIYDLDYSLGRLLDCLEETGLAHNTLVVFSADNGPEHYAYLRAEEQKHFSMGRLRGVKRDLYEGGHRVPLIASWPAVIKPGSLNHSMVNLTDWYATIAAIVGQQPDNSTGLDSMNILPILKDEANALRRLMLQDSCVNGIARAIRVGPWMYIDQESGELNRKKEPDWFRKMRNVEDVSGMELYNLTTDLGEGKNLVVAESRRAQSMKQLFDRLWANTSRSTPPFERQLESHSDGHVEFYEEMLRAIDLMR